jgi:hypothetical protein
MTPRGEGMSASERTGGQVRDVRTEPRVRCGTMAYRAGSGVRARLLLLEGRALSAWGSAGSARSYVTVGFCGLRGRWNKNEHVTTLR